MAEAQTATASGTKSRPGLPFIIGASAVGTLIEWYDFYIYGVLAVFFSQHFFPPGNDALALLASLGIFWTGFIVRPLGSVIFGHFGDRIGRKFTFMLTLLLMGGATFLVGVLPDYSAIGMLAPVLLVLLRIVQGLALGGEYGGAATYIAEHAPDGRRGFYTAWIQTTATLGIVVALSVILTCRLTLGDEAFSEWGWRIPFLLSALLVIASGYIRLRLEESPIFTQLKAQGKQSANPVGESFGTKRNWKLILLSLFGATAPEGVIWYTSQFYVLFYLTTVLKMSFATVYVVMIVALLAAAPFFIVFGALSDRIGRRNIMVTGFLLAIVSYWPAFTWFSSLKDSPVILTLLVFYLALLVTMVYGPIAAFLVEIFPARIRYTSMSLPYHVGNGVFGGGVPFIGGLITTATGVALSGLIYPISIAAIGVVVALAGLNARTHETKIWSEVDKS
jgi:MFS family permease